jgi:hypothetical protein
MALTIEIPGGKTQLSGNRVQAIVATDTVQGSLYRLLLKVTSIDGSFPAGTDAIEPDADKQAIFDLRNRVSMPIDYEFAWPLTGGVFVKHALMAKIVAINFGESFIPDNPPKQVNWAMVEGSETEMLETQILILKGGLSKHTQAKYNEGGKTFYSEYIEAGRFLTNLPQDQKICAGQPVKLWYITKEAAAQNVNLKVDYTNTDGTTGSASIAGTIDPDALYELCVDTGSLGLNGSQIRSYSVSLEKDGIAVSEIRTFNVDHTYYEQNTFVFYANLVGGIDCRWFTGNTEFLFPTTSQTSERNAQSTDTQKKATLVTDYKSGSRKWVVNTGYTEDIQAQESLIELLNSLDIWIPMGNDIIPVKLEDGDNPLWNKNEDLQNTELTFREAHS